MSAPPEAAKPVWCNLAYYVGDSEYPKEQRSVLMHGLPQIGNYVDTGWGWGKVASVTFATVLDGSFKAIIHVKEE